MIYAASNIAWPFAARHDAYDRLAEAGFRGLEIAPALFLADAADPFMPDSAARQRALSEIQETGLSLVSMQSLLFGVEGAALFEGPEPLARLERGIERAIDLAEDLGVPNLVFGSPRQRVMPDDMPEDTAMDLAADVFKRLGDHAARAGTVIAIEANPSLYGTNFLTDAFSTLALVSEIGQPSVRFILDLGERLVNDKMHELPKLLEMATPFLSHIHVSEPYLAPAPANSVDFSSVLEAISVTGYDGAISIEMKAGYPDPIAVLAAALDRVSEARNAQRGTP